MRISDWSSDVCSSDLHLCTALVYFELYVSELDTCMVATQCATGPAGAKATEPVEVLFKQTEQRTEDQSSQSRMAGSAPDTRSTTCAGERRDIWQARTG